MIDILLLVASPFIGILVGLLPAMGAFFTLILLFPLVSLMEPLYLIVFYAIMISARDFSGSVSALNFGLLGEVTSLPVLQERQTIVDHNRQRDALRNTMLGSLFGVTVGFAFFYFAFVGVGNFTFLLRSDVLGLLVLVTILWLLFWDKNRWYWNAVLLIFGFLGGLVGYDAYTGQSYFTLGNVYLAGGLPMMPLVLGLYGVPLMFDVIKHSKTDADTTVPPTTGVHKIKYSILIRSSVVGSMLGLVPYVGTWLSSNLAYALQKRMDRRKSIDNSLDRVLASETANNSAQVTVLIPFILLGIVLQPSELLVLDIVESKGWEVGYNTAKQTIYQLLIFVPIGCLITAILCYNLVSKVLYFIKKYIRYIIYSLVLIILINIFYLGFNSNQSLYHMIVFVISLILGFWLKKRIDTLPFLIAFLLQNQFHEVLIRLPILLF